MIELSTEFAYLRYPGAIERKFSKPGSVLWAKYSSQVHTSASWLISADPAYQASLAAARTSRFELRQIYTTLPFRWTRLSDQETIRKMTESPSTKVPYEQQNLHKGHHYIKDGNFLLPCQSSVNPLFLQAGQEVITVLDKQMARLVLEWDFSWVTKSGFGVRSAEAEAMRFVAKHTDVPVPEVLFTDFTHVREVTDLSEIFKPDFRSPEGLIGMTIIPGIPLEQKWDTLDNEAKESICLQLWHLLSKVRNIARPQEIEGSYQCAADGSLSVTQC